MFFVTVFSFIQLITLVWTLEYPKNLNELKYIEQITRVDLEGSDAEISEQVLSNLRLELNKIQAGNANFQDQIEQVRATNLTLQYLDFAQLNDTERTRCSSTRLGDLLFLIDYHSGHNDSQSVLKYFHHYALRLAKRCLPNWTKSLDRVVSVKLDEWTRSNMSWLLDCLLKVKFGLKLSAKMMKRPFTSETLQELRPTRPEASAIVLYLARMGDILVDDKMKNTDLLWDDFRESCEVSLTPLCKRICLTLERPTQFYSHLFKLATIKSQNINEAEQVISSAMNNNSNLQKWLVGKQICCQIVHSPKLLRKTYEQLVLESSVWQIPEGLSSLAHLEFDDN